MSGVNIKSEIDRLSSEIDAAELDLIQQKAHLAGLRAQRDALAGELALIVDQSRPSPPTTDVIEVPSLKMLNRTESIVEVLRIADRPMSIHEVWDGLKAGGRSEPNYQVVASTLYFLYSNGRITRVRRGRYAA